MKRLAVVCTHPIQYFVPIWRMLTEQSHIFVHVFYASDHSVVGGIDKEFGIPVAWDIPMLTGYESTFMKQRRLLSDSLTFFQYDRKEVDKIFKQERFDALLITAYDRALHLRAVLAANKARVPVLIRSEATDQASLRRPYWKEHIRDRFLLWLYQRISGFLSIGTCARRHFLKYGVEPERIFSSPYTVDTALFETQFEQFGPTRHQIRKDLGFGHGDFVFLYSGKMIEKKNPAIIADALALIRDKSQIGLLAVGDGKLKKIFEERAKKVIGNRAVFVGFINQSQLGRYYAAADAFILSSAWGETWGLVVNEAQIFGLPVIVSDKVGCREDLVIQGETGYVFPSGDAATLGDTMGHLASDRDNARQMGEQGRELARSYRVEDAVNGIVKALEYVKGSVK